MPVIGEKVYKKVELPTAGAIVTLLTNPSPDLWKEMTNVEDSEATKIMLATVIAEWNFTNADGSPAEINIENVGKALSTFDIAKIFSTLGMNELLLSEAKKNSSTNTSSPTETNQPPPNTQS